MIPIITQAKAILDGRKFEELGIIFGERQTEGFFKPDSTDQENLIREGMAKGADAILIISCNSASTDCYPNRMYGMAIRYSN